MQHKSIKCFNSGLILKVQHLEIGHFLWVIDNLTTSLNSHVIRLFLPIVLSVLCTVLSRVRLFAIPWM